MKSLLQRIIISPSTSGAGEEAESKAGELLELTIKDVKFCFRYCPAGTFEMGSPLSEANRYNNEQLHTVTLTQGFWMGETEITQEQWESVMGGNPSHFKGAKLPVECVSWNDCKEFVNKLNGILAQAPAVRDSPTPLALGLKGYQFALPTESQWEYACRAGTTSAYAGDLDQMAWYSENSGNKTHEVGTKKANVWGLYDMHGNVYEWCNDWYGDYSSRAASAPVIDPVGASSGSYRVSRGGSWCDDDAEFCRSANRNYDAPGDAEYFLGVRVALISGDK